VSLSLCAYACVCVCASRAGGSWGQASLSMQDVDGPAPHAEPSTSCSSTQRACCTARISTRAMSAREPSLLRSTYQHTRVEHQEVELAAWLVQLVREVADGGQAAHVTQLQCVCVCVCMMADRLLTSHSCVCVCVCVCVCACVCVHNRRQTAHITQLQCVCVCMMEDRLLTPHGCSVCVCVCIYINCACACARVCVRG